MTRHFIIERIATADSLSADVVSIFGERIEFVPAAAELDKPKWHIFDRHRDLAAVVHALDGFRLIEYIGAAKLEDQPRIVEMAVPKAEGKP